MTARPRSPLHAPFDIKELQAIFGSPVFTEGQRPEGGKEDAAFWLPILALFTGACLGELTGSEHPTWFRMRPLERFASTSLQTPSQARD
jgi:hypothetical protein